MAIVGFKRLNSEYVSFKLVCLDYVAGEVSMVRLRPVWMTIHPPSVL